MKKLILFYSLEKYKIPFCFTPTDKVIIKLSNTKMPMAAKVINLNDNGGKSFAVIGNKT